MTGPIIYLDGGPIQVGGPIAQVGGGINWCAIMVYLLIAGIGVPLYIGIVWAAFRNLRDMWRGDL